MLLRRLRLRLCRAHGLRSLGRNLSRPEGAKQTVCAGRRARLQLGGRHVMLLLRGLLRGLRGVQGVQRLSAVVRAHCCGDGRSQGVLARGKLVWDKRCGAPLLRLVEESHDVVVGKGRVGPGPAAAAGHSIATGSWLTPARAHSSLVERGGGRCRRCWRERGAGANWKSEGVGCKGPAAAAAARVQGAVALELLLLP